MIWDVELRPENGPKFERHICAADKGKADQEALQLAANHTHKTGIEHRVVRVY